MIASRLYLLWCYGKNQFLVGGAYNLVCMLTLAQDFSWSGFVYAFILKAFVFAILDEPFTLVDPVHIEAVQGLIREQCQAKGIIVTDHNYDAISTVADNLFVIADGYTSPVSCREDLVRHGYLRPLG